MHAQFSINKKIPDSLTVTGGNEAGVFFVLIQPFLIYYVNHVFLMLTSIFRQNLHFKKEAVCIKTSSTLASRSLKGWTLSPQL